MLLFTMKFLTLVLVPKVLIQIRMLIPLTICALGVMLESGITDKWGFSLAISSWMFNSL